MATKRKKKKKRDKKSRSSSSSSDNDSSSSSSSGSSGTMGSLRGGFKSVVGQGKKGKKESSWSKVLTYALLAAAIALLAWRLTR